MPEVSSWGCAAPSAVALPWTTLLQPEEPVTTPAVASKSQCTSCYIVISDAVFSRSLHVPAGAMAVLLPNCDPCAKVTSETAATDTVSRPKLCSGSAFGLLSVRQHASTAAETLPVASAIGLHPNSGCIHPTSQIKQHHSCWVHCCWGLSQSSLAASWHGRLNRAAGLLLWLQEHVRQRENLADKSGRHPCPQTLFVTCLSPPGHTVSC